MTTEPYAAQQQVITGRIELVGRIIILAAGLLLLCRDLTGTYTGWREDNSALFSVFARSHIQHGLGGTELFNTWGDAGGRPLEYQRYLNHPPLLSLLAAVPMLIFGDSEWVGRSVPIATTLGSVLLLMTIVTRLQSPILGLLSGLFYVMMPITAYFGRVLCHESPVQFFSLLMLHGYLQWAGLYGGGYSQKAGAAYYTLGVILGIGTGWAAVIMAGLIWLWHIHRTFRSHLFHRSLFWLILIPAITLTVVVIHILWGCAWNFSGFLQLFLSRASHEQQLGAGEWLYQNRGFFVSNFSIFGICAATAYLGIIPAVLRYAPADSHLRHIVRNITSAAPVLLTLLQGLVWMLLLPQQSWLHEYWQYFLSPFFAVSMAAVVFVVFMICLKWMPRLAAAITVFLVFLPIPTFARHLDGYYQLSQIKNEYNIHIDSTVAAMKRLNQYVSLRVPVMTSENYETEQRIGDRTNYGLNAQAAYYANRPLIHTTDINEIEANRQNCAAYILRATNDPNMYQLAQKLGEKYKLVGTERNYMIFLLTGRPKGD